MSQITFEDIVHDDVGFFIFHDIGQWIAVIAAFVFASMSTNTHFIYAGFAIAALSMITAAIPTIRIVLWPLAMGLVAMFLFIDPQAVLNFVMGNGPNMYFGIGVGWIYLALMVLAANAIVRVGEYTQSTGMIFLLGFGMFLYNVTHNKEL